MILSNYVSCSIAANSSDNEIYKVVYWYEKGNYRRWNPWEWDEERSYDEVEILNVLDNGKDCYTMMTKEEEEALEMLLLEHNFDDY